MVETATTTRRRIGRRIFFIILGLLVLGAVATVAISFYQPPMRLMPPPVAFLDDRVGGAFAVSGTENPEPLIRLFYATNRAPLGTREERTYARQPGEDLHAGVATIRVGDDATTWERIVEWSTRPAGDEPRPFLHLDKVDEQASIAASGALSPEAEAWFRSLNEALAKSRDKDIIIYVHGANTNLERAAGQAAQLQHFLGQNSVVVLFNWPTAENFLLYSRDMVTAAKSAPELARLMDLLAAHTDAARINVFTYSAGGTVGSKALSIVGREPHPPGVAPDRLGEVYHAAPDADFRGFVDDLKDYASEAERTTVAVNMTDSALRLSGIINRASRAGRPDMRELTPEATEWLLGATKAYGIELVRVRPENIPGLSNWTHTFWYEDPWVSTDVLITLLYHLKANDRGLDPGDTSFGSRYWTFAPDYLARLSAVIDKLRRPAQASPPAAPDTATGGQ